MSIHRYLSLIVFFAFISSTLISQENEQRALAKIKTTVSRWKSYNSQNIPASTPPTPSTRKLTQTELEKQKIISKFLCKKKCSETDIPLLRTWNHTYCSLLIEHAEFMNFIEHLITSNNARGLHLISATLNTAGLELAKLKPHEMDHALILKKEALTICHAITHMKNADLRVKQAVKEHLLYIKQHEPALVSYYKQLQRNCHELRVIHDPKVKNTVFPRLGWLPTDKSLSNLTPCLPVPVIPIKEDLEILEKRYKRLHKFNNYEQALQIAWEVAQAAPENSSFFIQAKKLIEHYAQKNNGIALCMLCFLDKNNPAKSIQHFIQAQIVRPGTLIKHPENTHPTLTLAALLGQRFPITQAKNSETAKKALDTILSFSNSHPEPVNKALALYCYKNAFNNPEAQLVCLQAAKDYVDKLPRDTELVPKLLTTADINFYYYQQLYEFAKREQHYSVKKIVTLNNFLLATQHLSQARIGLLPFAIPDDSGFSYYKRAAAAFKRNCLITRTITDEQIEKKIQEAAKEYEKSLPFLQEILLDGANGIPLSVEQRCTISTSIRAHPEHTDPLTRSLVTGSYEGSPYQQATAMQNAESQPDTYYRMLFAMDRRDYIQARMLAQEGIRHKIPYADMYLKNILFRTDDVLKTDAQKCTAIKNFLVKMADNPTKSDFALYCDAITTLEQMRQRNFLPAFALLIDQYNTERKSSSTQKLVALIAEAQTILDQKPAEHEIILNEHILQSLRDYCVNNNTMDPLYQYAQLAVNAINNMQPDMSSFVSFMSYQPAITQQQNLLNTLFQYFKSDITKKKKTSVFWTISKPRTDLIETLERILADDKMASEVLKKRLRLPIANLYRLFNPDFKPLTEPLD